MSLIIGIDPGSRLTGYGIIEKDGSKLTFVDAGTIRTETTEMPERLKRIFAGVERIVKFYGPQNTQISQKFIAEKKTPTDCTDLHRLLGCVGPPTESTDLTTLIFAPGQTAQKKSHLWK